MTAIRTSPARFILALLMGALAAAPLAAEAEAPPDEERLRTLVETLEDDRRRAEFIAQLKTLMEAQGTAPAGAAEDAAATGEGTTPLARALARARGQLDLAIEALARAPQTLRGLTARAGDAETAARWAAVLGKLALVVAAGLLAHWIMRRLLAEARRALERRDDEGLAAGAVMLLGRVFLDAVPVALFAAAAWLALLISEPSPATQILGLALINAIVVVQSIMVVARLVLRPDDDRRLIRLTSATARYALLWTRRLSAIAVFGYLAIDSATLLGVSDDMHALLLKLVGLAVAVVLATLILNNRRKVAAALLARTGADGGAAARRLAEFWHIPALLYVAAAFAALALKEEDGVSFLAQATLLTAVLALAAALLFKGIDIALGRGVRYFDIARRILQAVVAAATAVGLVEIWIGGPLAWLAGETGRLIAGRLVTIALVLVVAAAAWAVISGAITHWLSRDDGAGDSRLHTLLPLLRNAAGVVLGVVVALTVLSEMGVNIAPLLAGAGIAGIAVGFGAQSLVKDVITGVFMLLEDSVAVGDVVDLGGHAGVVEGMTVRTVRLRDLSGNVHVVPFGEIASVLNMTRDYSYALIEAGVAYKENVDDVVETLRGVADEMQSDEAFAPLILAPLEVLGLDSFGESSVNIRVRLKTLPGKQWGVRREFQRRLKIAFDARGIEIPFPHRTVFMAEQTDQAPAAPDKGRAAPHKAPDADDAGPDL